MVSMPGKLTALQGRVRLWALYLASVSVIRGRYEISCTVLWRVMCTARCDGVSEQTEPHRFRHLFAKVRSCCVIAPVWHFSSLPGDSAPAHVLVSAVRAMPPWTTRHNNWKVETCFIIWLFVFFALSDLCDSLGMDASCSLLLKM